MTGTDARDGGHVLVARLDNAGDVLLAGPAVRAVAAAARRVTFLAGPGGAAAARLLPGVDEVVVFRAPWVGDDAPPTDPAALARLVAQLASLGLDEALVLTSFHQSPLPLALVARLAGVGRVAATSEDHPGSLLDHRVRYDPGLHEVGQALAAAAALGYPLPEGDDGRLAVRLDHERPPAGAPARPYVVVHPGASVPARALPPHLAADLVAELADRGWAVALTGTATEAGLVGNLAEAAARPGSVVDLAGRYDLAELARLVRGAAALVSGNTGPAHLAAAVGTPVAEVFAPVVDPARWRPHGVAHVLLGDLGIACAGCRARRCPIAGQPCVVGVHPSQVADAVERLAGAGVASDQREVTA